MSKDFAILKQRWTDQAMADKELPRAAVVVVYRLAFGYLNAKRGDCFPAQDTLAADVGLSRRQLQNLLSVLVERGHLEVIRVGKKATNRYRPLIGDAQSTARHEGGSDAQPIAHHNDAGDAKLTAHHEEPSTPAMRNSEQTDAQSTSPAMRNGLRIHSNLLSEPLEEPHYPDPRKGIGGDNNLWSVFEDTSIEDLNTEARALERAASFRPEEEPDPVAQTYQEGEAIEIDGSEDKYTVEHVFEDRIIVRSWMTDDAILFMLNEDGSIDPTTSKIINDGVEYGHALTG